MTWNFELVAGPFKGRTGGLAWDGKGMLCSAVAEERVLRFDPASGKAENFRRWTGRVNGLAVAKDGSVFGAQEGGRRVIQFLNDGSATPVTEFLEGLRHNQPTDVVVDSKGRLWIADAYNAQAPYGPPTAPMLDHASVLRADYAGPGSWRLNRVTHDTAGPRALLLSADEKTLYVADGDADRGDVCQLLSYSINAYGSVGEHGKCLLNFAFGERGIEGMCLDSDGNIICCMGWKKSGSGAVLIVVSPGGTILETHPAPADMPMRCAFGDTDLGSLYVTAGDGGLYRAKGIGRRGAKR
ncbi:MAG TPA: SMP-30/gluconolactonase/LRE family protein [Burkholderiales bacterium]|nr:SMP-30/gluconolactonase/LRE family protein [Burkholderiales bacterium]